MHSFSAFIASKEKNNAAIYISKSKAEAVFGEDTTIATSNKTTSNDQFGSITVSI